MVDAFEDPAESVELAGAWMNVVFGFLVLVTPLAAFMLSGESVDYAETLNALVSGLAVIALAAFTGWSSTHGRLDRSMWSASVNALAGAWILVSPFVLNEGGLYLWALVTLGLFITFTAAYNAWRAWNAPRPATRRARA